MNNIVYFEKFYQTILTDERESFRSYICDKKDLISMKVIDDYIKHISIQLQKICLRMLIQEIQFYKQNNMLRGDNEEEEYNYFCEEIITQSTFIKKLYEQYPVLKECIEQSMEYGRAYYEKIINDFENDLFDINQTFGQVQKVSRIIKIQNGLGDTHQQGKQVSKIYLDNGNVVLYKPRSMSNEIFYNSILKEIEKSTDINQYYYVILSYEDHSWCEYIDYIECISYEQIKKYYKRLGVNLFVTYFLGTKDIHCENIIAHGEYPVIVDLEVLIHNENRNDMVNAEQILEYEVRDSVLTSGLLPVTMWNRNGKGVDVSGVRGNGGQVYPFKIPTIINANTSRIHIGYEQPVTQKSRNIPQIYGKQVDVSEYTKEIILGFEEAYKAVCRNKAVYKKYLENTYRIKNRIIFNNTQQYSMILALSYHPDFLKKKNLRSDLFDSIKCLNKETSHTISIWEKNTLLRGDIPYFYAKGNEKSLYADGEMVMLDYFERAINECMYDRLERMNKCDMYRQLQYVKLSIDMSGNNKEKCKNRVYSHDDNSHELEQERKRIEKPLKELTNHLLSSIIWNSEKTQMNWEIIGFDQSHTATWRISPMNMYLYSGLAGILLVFYKLQLMDKRDEIVSIFEKLRNQLFSYTDNGIWSSENLSSVNTGMYDGESSIIYTYLLLYEWSKDNIYLLYAVKHAEIVLPLLSCDNKFDLINGNAGAAKVLIKMYDITLEKRYLKGAEYAIEVLKKNGKKMDKGVGWKIVEDLEPMSGMAHGNSGIVVPVLGLWKRTHKEQYKILAKDIFSYEETLYNKTLGNWIDKRENIEYINRPGNVAWCHGAAGILNSRI